MGTGHTGHMPQTPQTLRLRLAAALLPRYANGTLPRMLRPMLQRALDDDAVLAARYTLLRRAERAAVTGARAEASDLGVDAMENMLGDLFDRLDAGETAETAETTAVSRPPWARLATVGPGVLAAACVVAFVVLPGSPPGHTDNLGLGGLSERGGDVSSHTRAPLGLRFRCLEGQQVQGDVVAGARQTGAHLECAEDGLLALSSTNLNDTERYVFAVAIDTDDTVHWLPGFAADDDATTVRALERDRVLETLLPMRGTPTSATIFVLWSDAPFKGTTIARALERADRAGTPLHSLERLPVDVDLQSRLTLERRR